MSDLAGRTVIITGAAGGQGAAEARRFVQADARVIIADLESDAGTALASELGSQARFVLLDVTKEADWIAALAAVEDWLPVRVLINNAGIHWTRDLVDETSAAMAKMLHVNVIAALLGIKAVVPSMTTGGGGSVINVGSVLGLVGGRGSVSYTTSKWALRGLTKTAAIELGPRGIRVNAVHPGYIATPMLAEVDSGRPADFYDFLPMGRTAMPDEVAELALYLASDASRYVTGADFVIDGGMTAAGGPRDNDSRAYRRDTVDR